LLLHPTCYAEILGKKMDECGSQAYLVNTGWCGGSYGVGSRINLPYTRAIIDSILDGSLDHVEREAIPVFSLEIPRAVNGVDSSILNPRNSWENKEEYDRTLKVLAQKFSDNFKKFTDNPEGKALEAAGPVL
jgi:phosphoenolpyruvate carboxykinase (ATP)